MKKLQHLKHTSRWPRRLTALAAASALAGCAFFDPYVGVPQKLPEGWQPGQVRFAGQANEEIDRVEAVRQDYLDRMEQMGRTRAVFGTGATVLTGWALYNTLKPNPPGVTETPIGDKRRTVRLGATIATMFGLSEYALNREQESAYNVGYHALTCLLRQSAPLLMPVDPVDATLAPQPDSVKALQRAMGELSSHILDLNLAVASARVGLAEGQALAVQHEAQQIAAFIAANDALPDKGDKAKGPKKLSPEELSAAIAKMKPPLPAGVEDRPRLRRTLDDAEKALRYARNALADGHALLKATAGSGREIRERAHTIVSTVNGLIGKAQPDLKAADVSLTKAQDIVSGFTKIGVETAKDQAESAGETTSALPPDLVSAPTPTASAPSLARIAGLGGPGLSMFGSSLATMLLANAAVAAKPAPAALTMEELQKFSDLVQGTLKEAKQRQAEEAKAKLIGGYVSKIEDLAKPKNVCRSSDGRCDTTDIARRIETLYGARRPVAATVLHFRAQAKAVRRVAGCPSEVGVRLTPNETVIAQPGDSYNFVVTQPSPGAPVALLQGAQGEDQAKLTKDSLGTAGLQVKIQFGQKARGRYTLLATDSSGEFSDSVQIIVKPSRDDDEPEKPQPKASGASS